MQFCIHVIRYGVSTQHSTACSRQVSFHQACHKGQVSRHLGGCTITTEHTPGPCAASAPRLYHMPQSSTHTQVLRRDDAPSCRQMSLCDCPFLRGSTPALFLPSMTSSNSNKARLQPSWEYEMCNYSCHLFADRQWLCGTQLHLGSRYRFQRHCVQTTQGENVCPKIANRHVR